MITDDVYRVLNLNTPLIKRKTISFAVTEFGALGGNATAF
jgi:hypothetical protein